MPLLILPIAIHGGLKNSASNRVPTFISEMFSMTTERSVALTMILHVVNMFGDFSAMRLNCRLKNEAMPSAFFFIAAVVACVILSCFGKRFPAVSLICLPLITCNVFAVNLLMISLVPLRVSSFSRASTVSGGLNSVTYLGCATVNFAVGVILPKYFWKIVMFFWTVLALILVVVCLDESYFGKIYIEKRSERCALFSGCAIWMKVNGEVCPDHIHILVSLPPKMSVSGFMGYLKGKSATIIFQKWGNMKFAYRNREFWCKGYYVDTLG